MVLHQAVNFSTYNFQLHAALAPILGLSFNLSTNGKPFHLDSKGASDYGLVPAVGGAAGLHAR